MQILIDAHEPSKIIEQVKVKFPDAIVASLGTDCGDLLVQLENGLLICERKQVPSDLCSSISDSRLFSQSEHIPRLCRFPFLVLDGELTYRDGFVMSVRPGLGWTKTGWRRESIEAALIKAQLNGMILVSEPEDYAGRIAKLIEQCEKQDSPHVAKVQTRNRNPFDDGTQQKIDFLATLPGVGTDKAVALVEARPSDKLIDLLAYILSASERDIEQQKIKLWGAKTRNAIREFFGMRPGQKLEIKTRSEWREFDSPKITQ